MLVARRAVAAWGSPLRRAFSSVAGGEGQAAEEHPVLHDDTEEGLEPTDSSASARSGRDVPERLFRRASNVVSLRFVLPFCNASDVRRLLNSHFPDKVMSLSESRTPHLNRTGRWFVELDNEATAREVVKTFHGKSFFGQRLHAWTVSPINLQSTTSRSVSATENALLFWDVGAIDYRAILRFFRGFRLKERFPVSSLSSERNAYKVSFVSQQEMFRALRERNHRPLSAVDPTSPIVRLRVL